MTQEATQQAAAPQPASQDPQQGTQTAPGAAISPAPTLPHAAAIGEAPRPDSAPLEADVTGGVVQYAPTGDPGLDMALGFFGGLGLGPDHPAIAAATNGDFTMLKATLGSNDKAKGWENYVALAERAHNDGMKAHEESVAKTRQLIVDAVGGEENWNAVKEWASANAEPEERSAVNEMLGAGGLKAKMAAQWLASQFSRASDSTLEPANAVSPNASSTPPAQAPMTAVEYAKQVDALRAKLGGDFDSSRQYQELQRRRASARARGI